VAEQQTNGGGEKKKHATRRPASLGAPKNLLRAFKATMESKTDFFFLPVLRADGAASVAAYESSNNIIRGSRFYCALPADTVIFASEELLEQLQYVPTSEDFSGGAAQAVHAQEKRSEETHLFLFLQTQQASSGSSA